MARTPQCHCGLFWIKAKSWSHWLMERGRSVIRRREQTGEESAITRQSYLLDTSAFVSLGSQVLQNLHANGYSLYASPYVFWERLCHLKANDFDRSKGQLLTKFEFIELLDDPLAYIERSLLPIGSDIHDRSEEADLIYAALAALRASESLSIFYSYRIQDPKNGVREIADCIEAVQKTLGEKEQKYQDYVRGLIRMISSPQVPFESDQDRHNAILRLVEAYVVHLAKRGASEKDFRLNVISDTYIHCSYILHRAFQLTKAGGTPSKNDYEDGRICLHLKLNTPYCLVTNDRGTRDALKETSLLLTRLNNPQFSTTLQVCDADHLKNLV